MVLDNQVAEPCRLLWVHPQIDDRPIVRVGLAPAGSAPAVLDRPRIGPGEHRISVSAAAACSSEGGDRPAVLQLAQRVSLDDAGARIAITLRRHVGGGLAGDVSVHGGRAGPRGVGGDVRCASRAPAGWALCHAELALARAVRARDVVRTTCVADKLRDMRLLGPLGAGREVRAVELAGDAELCVGPLGYGGDD